MIHYVYGDFLQHDFWQSVYFQFGFLQLLFIFYLFCIFSQLPPTKQKRASLPLLDKYSLFTISIFHQINYSRLCIALLIIRGIRVVKRCATIFGWVFIKFSKVEEILQLCVFDQSQAVSQIEKTAKDQDEYSTLLNLRITQRLKVRMSDILP